VRAVSEIESENPHPSKTGLGGPPALAAKIWDRIQVLVLVPQMGPVPGFSDADAVTGGVIRSDRLTSVDLTDNSDQGRAKQ